MKAQERTQSSSVLSIPSSPAPAVERSPLPTSPILSKERKESHGGNSWSCDFRPEYEHYFERSSAPNPSGRNDTDELLRTRDIASMIEEQTRKAISRVEERFVWRIGYLEDTVLELQEDIEELQRMLAGPVSMEFHHATHSKRKRE